MRLVRLLFYHAELDSLQYRATSLALTTRLRRCTGRRFTNILERRLKQLTSHGRTLDVPIRPHRLRDLVRLLGIDDAVGIRLRPQVSFQP